MIPAPSSQNKARKRRGWASAGAIVITAGPTREKIDPIRFISNYSTGTFGYEIAREAARRAGRVVLISGPSSLKAPDGVKVLRVESALEMGRAVKRELRKGAACLIMAAAVCDWRPRVRPCRKLKRRSGKMRLELIENPDILYEAGRDRPEGLVLVGFALETENLEKNAIGKLEKKSLDIVVANRIKPGAGVFGSGKFEITIFDRRGGRERIKGKSKRELAKIVLDKALSFNI